LDNLRFGILTVSDRSARGERLDASGPALEGQVLSQGWAVVRLAIVPDEQPIIQDTLVNWADSGEVDVI
jgi:molybdopterin biosynthesis enzyme MoaB